MSDTVARLCRRIGYQFENGELLKAALTHRSAGSRNNERLEFLGDGLLNFVIGEAVFRSHAQAPEGDLSRLRASLVRETTLAAIAQDLELGEAMRLGPGELKSGGSRRRSILADAVEALLGAVYIDGGFEAARDLVLALFAARLENLPSPESLKDPKTRLQEYLQGRHMELPQYRIIEVRGEAHRQVFQVLCHLADDGHEAHGQGSSRRRAEQDAAARLLELLQST